MKKVALSVLALLAAGSMAFAADLATNSPLTASVAAEGSTTITYDLGGAGFGIANATKAEIYFNLIGNANDDVKVEKSSTDKAGRIKADFRIGIKTATTGAQPLLAEASFDYAKIVIGDLYVKIAGATNPEVGYSDSITYFDANLVDGSSIKLAYGSKVNNQASAAGYEIGYSLPKLVDLTAKVGVDTATVSTTHTFDYSIGAALKAVDKLTAEGSFIGGTSAVAATNHMGVGVKAGYDLTIVNVWAAYNMDLTASTSTAVVSVEAPVIDGFKVSAAVSPLNTMDAIVKASVGDKLLQVGTLDVGYQLVGSKVYADLELTKLLDGLTAYAKVQYDTAVKYAVGASYTKLLDNVTFSGELNSTKGTAGQIALTAKIAL